MNFKRIHYFLTFCEFMHFSNAAKQLRISQPALAKAISKLEEELGTRLVRREGKNTHLTQYGRSAREVFASMMTHVYDVDIEIKQLLKNKHKQVRLGVNNALNFSLLAKFLATYHRAYPKVHVDIVDCATDDCDELLLKGKVDCLITHNRNSIGNSVCFVELYKERSLVVDGDSGTKNSKNQYVNASACLNETDTNTILRTVNTGNCTSTKTIVRTRQQLWAQQLIKQGVGFGIVSENAELIDGISFCKCNGISKASTVFAAIPIGRSDCQCVTGFYYMLKEHQWQ